MTKKCKSCKADIDEKATKCPHCRADQRNWFGRHKVLTGFLVIFVVFSLIGAVGSSSSKNEPSSTSQRGARSVTAPEAQPTPIVVDAKALVAEYDKNKLAAQEKYTGKVIQMSVFVTNVSEDVMGNYFLALKASNDPYYMGATLQCFFADKSALTSLSNGQSVTVAGTMHDMTLGIVMMKDCQLMK